MSMPGNGTLEVAEHQKQLSSQQQQQRLLDPLRPASGQVTPVFGKAHRDSLHFEYCYVQFTSLYFCDMRKWLILGLVCLRFIRMCDVRCWVFVVAGVQWTVMLWACAPCTDS